MAQQTADELAGWYKVDDEWHLFNEYGELVEVHVEYIHAEPVDGIGDDVRVRTPDDVPGEHYMVEHYNPLGSMFEEMYVSRGELEGVTEDLRKMDRNPYR